MNMETEYKQRTPTELLMNCLEDFGESEPIHAIVIYTNSAGDLCWQSTSNQLSNRVGMLECAKHYMLDRAPK